MNRSRLKLFDPSFEYGSLTALTGVALRRASLLDFSKFTSATGERAITPLRYAVLEVINANPGLQQIQLAEVLGITKAAASLAIDFWEARKCVSRQKSIVDRRSHGVHLTAGGAKRLDALRTKVIRHDAGLTSTLSEAEVQTLRGFLERIYDAK